MAHHTVWGVDIGNSAVKAVKMIRVGDEAHIVDFDIIDIEGGEEDGSRPARVQAALQTLCANHEFAGDPVYLSLPGDQCLFREFSLPPGAESKIEDLVVFEAKQQIPFPLDQVEMGWERYDEVGGGVGVELIVVRKAIVEEILKLTDQAKLNVQGITVSPMAQFNFIQYEYNPEGPTLLLDAGYKGTDFVVMQGRHIYSRTIPIGGREITRALESKLKVPYDKAEEVKKNIAQSKQPDRILAVIEPTLRQLGAEIQRTIGFWKSKSRGQKMQQGYLLGHTFRLPRMAETLAGQIREAPMTVVEGVRRIVLERTVNPDVFGNEFPTMAVAIGLGIQGLGLGELKVNLLPRERLTEIAVGRKKIWGALSAAAILLGLYVSYYRAEHEDRELKGLRAGLDAALDLAGAHAKEVDKVSRDFPAMEARLKHLARITRDRGRLLEIFCALSALRDDQGQPVFGARTKTYLTGLYVSRLPFNFETGSAPTFANPALSGFRRDMLRVSPAQKGPSSIYSFLQKVKNPLSLPPEKRPDVPISVVLSGECEGSDQTMFQVLTALEAALQKLPAVQDVKTSDRRSGLTRKEVLLNLNANGQPFGQKPVAGEREIPYSAFHVSFRWNPPDDPDLLP